MKKNVGTIDRIARLVIALIVIALYVLGFIGGTLAIVLLILSAVFLMTSLVSTCPLYIPFGISTCKTKAKE